MDSPLEPLEGVPSCRHLLSDAGLQNSGTIDFSGVKLPSLRSFDSAASGHSYRDLTSTESPNWEMEVAPLSPFSRGLVQKPRVSLELLHPPCPPPARTHRQVMAVMGAAAVLYGDAGAVGEQEAVITLAALEAAAGAAREAGESGTGALAGARAGGVVAVGGALERCEGGGGCGGSGLRPSTLTLTRASPHARIWVGSDRDASYENSLRPCPMELMSVGPAGSGLHREAEAEGSRARMGANTGSCKDPGEASRVRSLALAEQLADGVAAWRWGLGSGNGRIRFGVKC